MVDAGHACAMEDAPSLEKPFCGEFLRSRALLVQPSVGIASMGVSYAPPGRG